MRYLEDLGYDPQPDMGIDDLYKYAKWYSKVWKKLGGYTVLSVLTEKFLHSLSDVDPTVGLWPINYRSSSFVFHSISNDLNQELKKVSRKQSFVRTFQVSTGSAPIFFSQTIVGWTLKHAWFAAPMLTMVRRGISTYAVTPIVWKEHTMNAWSSQRGWETSIISFATSTRMIRWLLSREIASQMH